MTGHVVNVMPLAADELEAAALGPASAGRRHLRAGAVGGTDRRGQRPTQRPAAVPVHPHRAVRSREDSTLTRAAYRALGGIRGAVASRAEEIYQEPGCRAARGEPPVVPAAGHRRPRLRDPPSRDRLRTGHARCRHRHHARRGRSVRRQSAAGPRSRCLVGCPHRWRSPTRRCSAEWERLRRWIDDGRDDLRQHAAYTLAVDEWLTAGRDPDYLLTGGRLDQFEQWRATTTMRLTACEQEFLDEALRRRDEAEAAEIGARCAEQARLRRRARRRAFALGADGGRRSRPRRSSRSMGAAGTVETAADRGRRLDRLRRRRAGRRCTSKVSSAPNETSTWTVERRGPVRTRDSRQRPGRGRHGSRDPRLRRVAARSTPDELDPSTATC